MPDGRLIVCATPIGNLGDVTLRVLDALKDVDAVLAEDTRVTRKLLARHGISTPLERYDEAVAAKRTGDFVDRMRAGETARARLRRRYARHQRSRCASGGCGARGRRCGRGASRSFGDRRRARRQRTADARVLLRGLLPRKQGDRRRLLATLAELDATLVFYESPKRTAAALASLASAFPRRTGAMARELTKLHEEVVRGELPVLAEQIASRDSLKGEVVLLVGPPVAGESVLDEEAVRESIDALVADGSSRAAAVKEVAARYGAPRNAVYEIAHRRPAG